MAELSIQESLYPTLTCFGCGHANPDGFHLRSYRRGEEVVARFTSLPAHDNGFGFLNGGIITTVLDCHGAALVMQEAADRGWEAEPGAPVPFITAGIDVRFLRPTPLAAEVELTAQDRAGHRGGDRGRRRARWPTTRCGRPAPRPGSGSAPAEPGRSWPEPEPGGRPAGPGLRR